MMPTTVPSRWPGSLQMKLAMCSILVALTGCASPPPPPPKPTVVTGSIEVQPDVNPDATGRPSPVIVRLYELKAYGAFRNADFFSIFDREQQTLGGELLAKDEFRLEPGDKRSFKRNLQGETRFLGVVAAYRDLEHSQWRASLTVLPNVTQPAVVRVEANKISIRSK